MLIEESLVDEGENSMQIKEIEIQGLLGINSVCLNFVESNAFIAIHGPNGVGKTHVMKIVNSLLSLSWADLVTMPFKSAKITFDEGRQVEASRIPDDTGDSEISQIYGVKLNVRYRHDKNETELWSLSDGRPTFRVSLETRRIIKEETGYEARTSHVWISSDGQDKVHLSKLLERYPDLRNRIDSSFITPLPPGELAMKYIGPDKVSFVDTHRLIQESTSRNRTINDPKQVPAIRERAARMRTSLSQWSAMYLERSTTLDASFASRVLNESSVNISDESLFERHDKLIAEQEHLRELRLISGVDSGRLPPRDLNQTEKVLVQEFLNDLEKKLSVLEHPARQVSTFLNAVNSNFIGKSIRLDPKRGLRVESIHGELLDVTALSSGEQHYLVMLYDIIFSPEDVHFVLLDEPEISLHPQWQRGFLDILRKVNEERGTQFLVATHSPMILGPYIDDAVFIGPKELI